MSQISFHVRHEVRPERVFDLLRCISRGTTYSDITQADRQLARAKMLGLIDDSAKVLTPTGIALLTVLDARANLAGDLGHFLHYSLWNSDKPDQNAPAFLYRTFTNFLFEQGVADGLDSRDELERICVELVNSIEGDDRFTPFIDSGLSLSPDSLRGIMVWLEALRPSVLEDGKFQRRDFCPPELLLLAIGYVMRDELDAVDVDILLSHARREEICRVCLLDPSAFDQALDWMIPLFPKIILASEDAGYYGRYIRLHKRPTLEDIVR